MKLRIPLTGTVLAEGSVFGEGKLSGDPNDPIRPIDIDLGNVSWRMVDVDLENEVMIIEVSPPEKITEDSGTLTKLGNPRFVDRPITKVEKTNLLQHAKDLVEGHTKNELYAISKCPKLKRPFKEKL